MSGALPFGILGKGLMLWEGCIEVLTRTKTLQLPLSFQNFSRASEISGKLFVLILRKEAAFLKFTLFTWWLLVIVKQWLAHGSHPALLISRYATLTQKILPKLFGNKCNWRHITFKLLRIHRHCTPNNEYILISSGCGPAKKPIYQCCWFCRWYHLLKSWQEVQRTGLLERLTVNLISRLLVVRMSRQTSLLCCVVCFLPKRPRESPGLHPSTLPVELTFL